MDVSLGSVMWEGQAVAHAACPPPPPLCTSETDPTEQQGHYSLVPATSQELPECG